MTSDLPTPRKQFTQAGIKMGGRAPLFLFAGPCVIEGRKPCLAIAKRLASWAKRREVPLVFKASYDKANRTSLRNFRGPGLEEGLDILAEVRATTGLPVITDVHSPEEALTAGLVVDVIQIPAFLCRQTDLLLAAGESGQVINIKKGQFMSPWDVGPMIDKVLSTGNRRILLTDRGVSYGYNNLVADMRSIPVMKQSGCPVVFDATHSVQRPGGGGGFTSGDGELAPTLAKAAVAAGCDGIFMETHLNPAEALSDKANTLPFAQLDRLWKTLCAIQCACR